jgi:hypothetical protein
MVQMEPMAGYALKDLDFTVVVHTDRYDKRKGYLKGNCVKIDDDTYAAPVDSEEIGTGKYFATVTVYIPDTYFIDGIRKDVSTFYTGMEILP